MGHDVKLWHLYDCTDYAANLYNCPTVAYSGENDAQKQAADIMAKAIKEESYPLVHIIGPKTGHSYHPDAKREINRRIDQIAKIGRERMPYSLSFVTFTLRYNQSGWVRLDELETHWEKAVVSADIDGDGFRLTTHNVCALTLTVGPGEYRTALAWMPSVMLDGQELKATPAQSDRSWTSHYRKEGETWRLVEELEESELRKRHGLQGPIDDAFMDSFLMVRPTGKPMNDKVGAWASAEMKHAIDHWRKQFRGEARVKDDNAVSDDDIAAHNLVLWGDPSSNQILAKIAAKLPIHWDDKGIHVGDKTYDAAHHVPLLIYPNPLNPKRYVVLNSGFTFREYDYLNNARQVPKLPVFAVVNVDMPVTSRLPGGIVAAGFFDEKWQVRAGE